MHLFPIYSPLLHFLCLSSRTLHFMCLSSTTHHFHVYPPLPITFVSSFLYPSLFVSILTSNHFCVYRPFFITSLFILLYHFPWLSSPTHHFHSYPPLSITFCDYPPQPILPCLSSSIHHMSIFLYHFHWLSSPTHRFHVYPPLSITSVSIFLYH